MKIGLFDSGLGGLTILKAVVKELPQYDYVFYGDTANVPYGDKTEKEIYELTQKGIVWLFERGVRLVIVACNTASAETVRKLQNEFLPEVYPDRKILGIIVPTIEELCFAKPTKVLLIATKRTVESKKYDIELAHKGDGTAELTSVATPELVPLIELGELEAATSAAIKRIDAAGESEVIVLGCTHYTQIAEALRGHYSDAKQIISQDEVVPGKLQSYLENHPEIASTLTNTSERTIHLTLHRPDYDVIMGQLLGGVYMAE